ncbi:MAG TPA: hypothetical protein VNO30_24645 [Kofleriaceae bacterium]|nr:hypothetical protein [Kofleriaceae bacterium]
MRDLELWRRLAAGDAAGLLPELAALAERPPGARAPFLGAIAPLAEHADPALRAVAVRALAGARGVPGLRVIVQRLDDPDPDVRRAALAALRQTAADAPKRYAHALFHRRADVRLAAIADAPRMAEELVPYLRGDPACAAAAAEVPWPSAPLPLAFDLHAAGALADLDLLHAMARTSATLLRAFCEAERGRTPDVVDAYFEQVLAARRWLPAPGADPIDQVFAAIDAVASAAAASAAEAGAAETGAVEAGAGAKAVTAARAQIVEAVTGKGRSLARRAAAALLACYARRGAASPHTVAICCALEPRVLELASFDPAHADTAARGLIQLGWPVRPPAAHVERLLQGPLARGSLGLAAALAGLFSAQRLTALGKIRGEDAIVSELLASDRGWDEVCRLPAEAPPQELVWLARIEQASPRRYAELAARALTILTGKRLEAFVDQIPAAQRAAVLLQLAARGELDPAAPVVGTVSQLVAAKLERAALAHVLGTLLAGDARGTAFARELARVAPIVALAVAARELPDAAALRLVAAIDGPDALPRNRELALAKAFTSRAEPELRAWALRVSHPPAAAPAAAPQPARGHRALTEAEAERIATCADRELEAALAPALATPVSGLAPALARRGGGCESVAACVALLGCADPYPEVAAQLDRFGALTRAFENALDRRTGTWLHHAELSPLAHAWLFRWEAHDLALARWIDAAGGVLAALGAGDVPGALAAHLLWRGVAEVVVFLRYREPEAFRRHATPELAAYAADRIDRPFGCAAARILVTLVEGGAVPLSDVRTKVLDRAALADGETREHLQRILRLDGMPEPPRRAAQVPASASELAQVRRCKDPDALIAWCRRGPAAIVEEAALALVLRGAAGQLRLAALLGELAELPAPVPVIASIALWDSEDALDRARELAGSTALPPQWRFHLALGLVARGDQDELPRALDAARAPGPAWFSRDDWDKLVELSDPRTCALALADAPHHFAYQPAVRLLLEEWDAPEVADALRRFLEAGTERPLHLRRAAARRLVTDYGDPAGLPILIEELADEGAALEPALCERLPRPAAQRALEALIDAALLGGDRACTERRMWSVLELLRDGGRVDAGALGAIYARVLEGASTAGVRRAAAVLATAAETATGAINERLRSVAEVFAWGVRRGLELTGRRLRVHMTSKERDLGHTFLDGARIFVSPLPMLRREPHGQDIVEGLILHELGHHVYHRGEAEQALWQQAHKEGLGHLLNLVADEHLERNLRAIDPAYGDRLKRLGAFAFHHAAEEIGVAVLLGCLRGHTARALIAAEPEVAFDEGSLRLRRGAVLAELDRAGHPLARFSRALRMGLGNRSGDPLIAAALELCGKGLRRQGMRGLYDLTRQLAGMFGGAIAVARVFGGPEGMTFGERDQDVHGAGLDDDILQREVERILEPRRGGAGRTGPRDRLCINVGPDEEFDRIASVVRVRGDRAEHARIAAEVARHSQRLRALLDDLGLRREPVKARLSGHALDRGRLRALVTRGDPRILVARTPVRRTDLFLGVAIDCSGSMSAGDNIERARRFAILITEAVRPLAGVEARFFGFTDSQIYDAGDAADCGVTGLHADGGNNDAAGLYHAASVAAASRKRAKVLVMISDGLPTQCSVAAVRGLVTTLTRRRGMVCAQVAVRPLEEVMFPHYVVLDDDELDVAVARFGRMIGGLARRVLAP